MEASNPGCRSQNEWPRAADGGGAAPAHGSAPRGLTRGRRPAALVHQTRRCFDQNEEGITTILTQGKN
jgi:hypothetical protein